MSNPKLISTILMETLENQLPISETPGARQPQHVGARIREKVTETYGATLPLPGDFKSLPAEKISKLRPITVSNTPADPTEAAVQQYLRSIGISLDTAQALELCYLSHTFIRDSQSVTLPALVYPFTVNGKLISLKYRSCAYTPSVKPDQPGTYSKDWNQVTSHSEFGITPCFIDTLAPEHLAGQRVPQLIITEGEKDCLALYEAGYRHFISVPTGASSEPGKYLAPFVDWFTAVDSIIICGDSDYPGRQMTHTLSEFFGPHASVVDLPADCKDIADVLLKHGKEEVQRVIRQAHPRPTKAIRRVADQQDEIIAILQNRYDHGYTLGYGPLTDHVFHPDHTGGLVVVSGQPNSGKSDFLNDLMMHLMTGQDMHILFLSFETPNKAKHNAHMVELHRQTSDLSLCPKEMMAESIQFLDQHMAHLDLQGEERTPEHILELADQHRRQSGLDYFIIDPYLFIELKPAKKNESETESIKRMLTLFQTWGQEHHIWVYIVAHPRKNPNSHGGFTNDEISPNDIAASAHWSNLADFLFVIKRENEPNRHYTELRMIKVRDQNLCSPGRAYFVRTNYGAYLEQPSPEACEEWYVEHMVK